ncbi:MAG: RloB family protein [Thermoguttaceae bacterium]|nr:RloB family protein [Thermoguttaceae bacterium]
MAKSRVSRKLKSLASVRPDHIPCNRIFIAMEGRKTEPRYFQALKKTLRRDFVILVPNPNDESSPDRVLARLQEYVSSQDDFDLDNGDLACLVLDVDEHSTLKNACDAAQNANFDVFVSNPCFELWLLLHFKRLGSKLTKKNSTCVTKDQIVEQLSAYLTQKGQNGYSKEHYDTQVFIQENAITQAIANAKRLVKNRQIQFRYYLISRVVRPEFPRFPKVNGERIPKK